LNRWEWEGMGMLKAIPPHLYIRFIPRILQPNKQYAFWGIFELNGYWLTLETSQYNKSVPRSLKQYTSFHCKTKSSVSLT